MNQRCDISVSDKPLASHMLDQPIWIEQDLLPKGGTSETQQGCFNTNEKLYCPAMFQTHPLRTPPGRRSLWDWLKFTSHEPSVVSQNQRGLTLLLSPLKSLCLSNSPSEKIEFFVLHLPEKGHVMVMGRFGDTHLWTQLYLMCARTHTHTNTCPLKKKRHTVSFSSATDFTWCAVQWTVYKYIVACTL